jgi:hypothetical protein
MDGVASHRKLPFTRSTNLSSSFSDKGGLGRAGNTWPAVGHVPPVSCSALAHVSCLIECVQLCLLARSETPTLWIDSICRI